MAAHLPNQAISTRYSAWNLRATNQNYSSQVPMPSGNCSRRSTRSAVGHRGPKEGVQSGKVVGLGSIIHVLLTTVTVALPVTLTALHRSSGLPTAPKGGADPADVQAVYLAVWAAQEELSIPLTVVREASRLH